MKDRRIRRAKCLISYWESNDLVVENYVTGGQVIVTLPVMFFINSLTLFVSLSWLESKISSANIDKGIIGALLDENILLVEGEPNELRDMNIDLIWKWGHNAKYFHFSTQSIEYNFNFEEVRNQLKDKALLYPPPSPFKDYPLDKIYLTKNIEFHNKSDFWQVLLKRRTCREFNKTPIKEETFTKFVYTVFGQILAFEDSEIDSRILKTSPSGGSRHPIEVYPIILNVENIPAGIYHYSVKHHALELLSDKIDIEKLSIIFSRQEWIRDASVLFLFTAVLERSMWKYDHSRAYRVITLDAGHLGQTFHLVGTALDLGVFTTAAIQDKEIETLLSIDGIKETPIYAGAIGAKKMPP